MLFISNFVFFYVLSVWELAFPSCVQALWRRHHLRGDGHVHESAAGASVRVGPPEEAWERRSVWCSGEAFSTSEFKRRFLWLDLVLKCEVLFQVEGCFPDTMTRCAELISNYADVDFVDINSGCPIDLVYKKVNSYLTSFLVRLFVIFRFCVNISYSLTLKIAARFCQALFSHNKQKLNTKSCYIMAIWLGWTIWLKKLLVIID